MPARKSLPSAARPSNRAPSQRARRNVNSILVRREQLVAEIARLRAEHHGSNLVENAQQLLTRWWATAGWSAREELLRTVDWLVRVERCREKRIPSAV